MAVSQWTGRSRTWRDLRSRGEIRRAYHDRRRARDRVSRQDRPRHTRISRRDGQDRYHYRNAGQSARGRERRIYKCPQGNCRSFAATLAAIFVSNTIAPPVVAASLKALELLSASTELRD